MSNKLNNPFDRELKNRLEQYDFEYNDKAWQQMNVLLDKKPKKRRGFWWFFTGAGAVVLIVVVGYLGLIDNTNPVQTDNDLYTNERSQLQSKSYTENINSEDKSEQKIDNASQVIEVEIDNSISNQSSSSNLSEDQSEQTLNRTNTSKNQPASVINQITKKKENAFLDIPKVNSSTSENKLNSKNNLNSKKVASPSISNKIDLDNNKGEINLIQNSPASLTRKRELNEQENKTVGRTNLSLNTPIENQSKLIHDKQIELVIEETRVNRTQINRLDITDAKMLKASINNLNIENKIVTVTPPKPNNKAKNHLVVGITGAWDMSSAGMDKFTYDNWKVGALVEYRFANKFGARIGVNYLEKSFDANKEEYDPKTVVWPDLHTPYSSIGQYKILEIPLALNYYLNSNSKNGVYFTGGVNSYFMLQEQYDYFFSNPDFHMHWWADKKNDHFFGQAELAIGYQYYLKNNLMVQIEPFVQLPINGMGHGQVNLWSFGLQARINLDPR